jgi:uncharacterized protein (TIGR04141 family)
MSLKRLTVFLLRDIATIDEAIRDDRSPKSIPLDPNGGVTGRFFYQDSHSNPPSWVTEVSPILSTPVQSVFAASASGLLIIETSKRFFAITFGYGKGFLNPAKIQRQFGLRVALNRINPSQIRSMDTKTFEDMVVTKNTQASRSSDIPTFGVDVSRDILRAVAGEPRDPAFAKRLAGSDALVLSVDLLVSDVPKKCDELLVAYNDVAYKADFEWIDHLEIVEIPSTVSHLDKLLEVQLKASDTTHTHMATPDPVAWEDIDAFKIGGTSKVVYDDLDLDAYLLELGAKTVAITIDRLKSRNVSVRYTRSADFDGTWNVYQCLISEQRLNGQLYVLIEGRWFGVSDTLVGQVDRFLTSLPTKTLSIDNALSNEVEPAYNARMASIHPSDLLLLDAKIKRPGGASSGIEFCDLLAANGDIIHVKRKSRSSTLSHLFAQGSISATTFVSDGEYRDELRATIVGSVPVGDRAKWLALIPDSSTPVNKQLYTICYVVLTKGSLAGIDWLPFFSKLNLMQHGKQLQTLGFTVSVTPLSN